MELFLIEGCIWEDSKSEIKAYDLLRQYRLYCRSLGLIVREEQAFFRVVNKYVVEDSSSPYDSDHIIRKIRKNDGIRYIGIRPAPLEL